jgi:hypothetical protein
VVTSEWITDAFVLERNGAYYCRVCEAHLDPGEEHDAQLCEDAYSV